MPSEASQHDRNHTIESWAAASLVGINLSISNFLELDRADVAQRRMATDRIVDPLDVIEHVGQGLCQLPGSVNLRSDLLLRQ